MTNEPTYELCYDPRDADALIYRSIPAGICGPFSEPVACESREAAETFAQEHGYAVSGEWSTHTNYDSAPLIRVPPHRSSACSRPRARVKG